MEVVLKFNNELKSLGLIDLTPKLKLECKTLKNDFDNESAKFINDNLSLIENYLADDEKDILIEFGIKYNEFTKLEKLQEFEKHKKSKEPPKIDNELLSDINNLRQTVFNKALNAYKLENQDKLNIDMLKLLASLETLTDNEKALFKTEYTSDFWQNQACKETVKAVEFFRRGGL